MWKGRNPLQVYPTVHESISVKPSKVWTVAAEPLRILQCHPELSGGEIGSRRPALGAPDVDGWCGREHMARLLTNKDSDSRLLFRQHLILPFLHSHLEPQYAPENASGHLFAFFKPQGGIRLLLCGSVFRRCFASLAADSITDECTEYFTTSFPNFMQCAGGLKDGTCVCAKSLQLFDSVKHPADKT